GAAGLRGPAAVPGRLGGGGPARRARAAGRGGVAGRAGPARRRPAVPAAGPGGGAGSHRALGAGGLARAGHRARRRTARRPGPGRARRPPRRTGLAPWRAAAPRPPRRHRGHRVGPRRATPTQPPLALRSPLPAPPVPTAAPVRLPTDRGALAAPWTLPAGGHGRGPGRPCSGPAIRSGGGGFLL